MLARGPVLVALTLTALGASAMFTVYTYIVPLLQVESGASVGFVAAMLVIYGLGLMLDDLKLLLAGPPGSNAR